jgi:hypothetical protein
MDRKPCRAGKLRVTLPALCCLVGRVLVGLQGEQRASHKGRFTF